MGLCSIRLRFLIHYRSTENEGRSDEETIGPRTGAEAQVVFCEKRARIRSVTGGKLQDLSTSMTIAGPLASNWAWHQLDTTVPTDSRITIPLEVEAI